ncbi:IpaD/SipD/SspD family type III secretion system needle tip protein [Salmonella enterica]|nr:IpaD/SipD/SspD family type III secretion system needle tip protein [Salmonella enterica]EIP9519730.1 IpaD/SipD/SspD family type III secretion system needle tip protein [Salmonella enterica]
MMLKYVNMYQDYNDTVVNAAAEALKKPNIKFPIPPGASDIYFDTKIVKNAFNTFYDKYKDNVNVFQGRVIIDTVVDTDDEVNNISTEQIKKELEQQYKNISPAFTPVFFVNKQSYMLAGDKQPDGHYKSLFQVVVTAKLDVKFNFPSKTPKDGLPLTTNYFPWCSITRYQAWLASFNAFGNQLQSNMQSFSQTYSQVNSTFNNLNKVLSSTITALGESANFVLKSLS